MFIVAVVIGLFFLFRAVLLWYWKVDVTIKNQVEIIRLLKKIAGDEDVPELEDVIVKKENKEIESWICPKCGRENTVNDDLCEKCGNRRELSQ